MTEQGSTFGQDWLNHLVIEMTAMERHDYASYLLPHLLLLALEYEVIRSAVYD